MGISWRLDFCSGNSEPRTQNLKFKKICKICLNNMKRKQGKAIYTAECGHAFHFACLATNTTFVCPVCNATWNDLPILASHNNNHSQQNDVVEDTIQIETTTLQQPQPTHSDLVRSYKDDEPLPFPITCTRIVPIPEADETAEHDQNDDAAQLQSIFVNSNDGDSRILQVKLMPECAVLSLSRTHVTYVFVLKLKAPPSPPPPQRAAIDLVTVLGVDRSMSGAKLHMLRRAMRFIISSLGSSDRLAIVAFAATSKRLLPLRRMTSNGQRVARRVVERLVCGQGNNVGEALMKAAKVLEDRRERNPVATVILLTDGPDERVQTGENTNQRKCFTLVSSTRLAHIETPVHWFGLKTKSRNKRGDDDLAKGIKGILSVVVQDLRIRISFEPGSAQAEISAVYSCSGPPTALSVDDDIGLGNMYGGKEKELLVEVRVSTSALGAHQVMKVRCMYKDPTGQEVVVHDKEEAVAVVLPPERGVSCNGRVERIRNMLITRQAIAESRRLVKEEKISSAHDLVASAKALVLMSGSGSGSGSGQEFVRTLEGELVEIHRQKQEQQEETTVGERKVDGIENGDWEAQLLGKK